MSVANYLYDETFCFVNLTEIHNLFLHQILLGWSNQGEWDGWGV